MNRNNSIVMGVGALLALVISLPMEWMSIHNATLQLNGLPQGFGDMMSSSLGNMTMKATGMNGSVTFLFKMPIWLIVTTGIAGIILALLNSISITSLPKPATLIPLAISAFYTIVAMGIAVSSSEATLGAGGFIALLGLALGFTLVLRHREVLRAQPEAVVIDPIP